MTWKERALQAADTKAAREEDEQRLRDAQARAKQIKAFQFALRTLLEEDITVDDLQVTADGVTFRWTFEHISRKWGIVMQGVCPDCCGQGKTDTRLSHPSTFFIFLGTDIPEIRVLPSAVVAHLDVRDHIVSRLSTRGVSTVRRPLAC